MLINKVYFCFFYLFVVYIDYVILVNVENIKGVEDIFIIILSEKGLWLGFGDYGVVF